MVNATDVLLSGSSAGGYGIMYNYKAIVSILESNSVFTEINLLLDSCFVDIPPEFDVTPCLQLYLNDYNNSICNINYRGQSCCVQSDCMIPKFMSEVKVFGVSGIYD